MTAVLLTGCTERHTAVEDASLPDRHTLPAPVCDAPQPPAVRGCEDNEEGVTRTFVIRQMELPSLDTATGQLPGFNIDGCNTVEGGPTGCGHMDGRYDINRDGVIEGLEEGIDNQMAQFADLPPAHYVTNPPYAPPLLLLVVIEGINDPVGDDCVDISLWKGALPEGARLDLEGDGGIMPGQTFEVNGDPAVLTRGVIREGRVYFGPTTFLLAIPVDDTFELTLQIQDTQATFDLTDELLEAGLIGGGIRIRPFVDDLARLLGDDLATDGILEVLGELADLDPDAHNENCQAMSTAFAFDAVEAVIE